MCKLDKILLCIKESWCYNSLVRNKQRIGSARRVNNVGSSPGGFATIPAPKLHFNCYLVWHHFTTIVQYIIFKMTLRKDGLFESIGCGGSSRFVTSTPQHFTFHIHTLKIFNSLVAQAVTIFLFYYYFSHFSYKLNFHSLNKNTTYNIQIKNNNIRKNNFVQILN